MSTKKRLVIQHVGNILDDFPRETTVVIMSDDLSSGMVSGLAVVLQMQNLLAKVLNEYSTHYLTFGVKSCAVNSKFG